MKKCISARLFAIVLTLGGAALLGACSSTNHSFNDDHASPNYSIRAVKRLQAESPSGIEFEVSQVRAKGAQLVCDGITFNSINCENTVNPPTTRYTLNHRATFSHAHLAYNHLLFGNRPVQLEWFAGVALGKSAWHTESTQVGAVASDRSKSWVGAIGGITGRWKVAPWLTTEGRAWAAGRPFDDGSHRIAREVALVFLPTPALKFRVGYAESDVETYDPNTPGASTRLTATVRGAFLGLVFDF